MPRVALVTCAELPEGDEDFPALIAALTVHAIDAEPVVWNDPEVDWPGFDLVVLRCTWDYARSYATFLSWLARVEAVSTLINSSAVVRWNTDKRYLRELQAARVPVVETRWIEPGEPVDLPADLPLVVKPAISAGARDTARYAAGDPTAREHARALRDAGRTVMVQPYLEGVDAAGETAVLFFDGNFSHAIRKGPILREGEAPTEALFAAEEIRAREPQPEERAIADKALALVGERVGVPAYARIDLVPDRDGDFVVLEVELTEPSLFLGYGEGAAERFAATIARRLPT